MANKKLSDNDIENSKFAIEEYINYKNDNCNLHEAHILISSMGKNRYNGKTKVHAKIETNHAFVRLIGDVQFEADYHQDYSNQNQKFKFINGTLIITAEDLWGESHKNPYFKKILLT